jgi:hypothetical protein
MSLGHCLNFVVKEDGLTASARKDVEECGTEILRK